MKFEVGQKVRIKSVTGESEDSPYTKAIGLVGTVVDMDEGIEFDDFGFIDVLIPEIRDDPLLMYKQEISLVEDILLIRRSKSKRKGGEI